MKACVRCGNTENVGRFCPVCGAEQPQKAREGEDPLVGALLGERYEITELVNVGGMGRVYRGLHRTLERPVAIKVIHPHLLTSEALVARFLAEARTASRLNHPNVVSIYDFGRTAPADGGRPYLVMELLSGKDLSYITDLEEPVGEQRAVHILLQVLAALGEAHHLGIIHRDVKPENIILEPTRSGGELVKVIDFGIARIENDRRLTQDGTIMGSPYYMAPEQITGQTPTPLVDLYAVGVIMFQLLTGKMPFDGSTATAVLQAHLSAKRPNPQEAAPGKVSDALAAVCVKALSLDPAQRYPDAISFASALQSAAPPEELVPRRSMLAPADNTARFSAVGATPPPRPSSPGVTNGRVSSPSRGGPVDINETMVEALQPPPVPSMKGLGVPEFSEPELLVSDGPELTEEREAPKPSPPPVVAERRTPNPVPTAPLASAPAPTAMAPKSIVAPSAKSEEDGSNGSVASAGRRRVRSSMMLVGDLPLIGRGGELSWIQEVLAGTDGWGVLLRGPSGVGRSRLLQEASDRARSRGVRVVNAPAPRAPLAEARMVWLRTVLPALLQLPENNPELIAGTITQEMQVSTGLRAIYRGETQSTPESTRASIARVFRWAVERAVQAAGNEGLLLAIDDVDLLGTGCRGALADFLRGERPRGFSFLLTSTAAPGIPTDALSRRVLKGFSRAEYDLLAPQVPEVAAWPSGEQEVEPLYFDLSRRWAESLSRIEPPQTLAELVSWRMSMFPTTRQLVLAAVALTGGASSATVAHLLKGEGDIEAALRVLTDGGFLLVRGGVFSLKQAAFIAPALQLLSADKRSEMHSRAAEAISKQEDKAELRAYHLLRARRDLESFVLQESAARARAARGDDEGAIVALYDGVQLARAASMRGESDAALDAWVVFGRKLGQMLLKVGRTEEALGVLVEVRELTGPKDVARALVLEQLAAAALQRGRSDECGKLLDEAIVIARHHRDESLLVRLRSAPRQTEQAKVGSLDPNASGRWSAVNMGDKNRRGS